MTATLDLTPSPAAYEKMLLTIIEDSSNEDDRQWAVTELQRVGPAIEAGTWSKPVEWEDIMMMLADEFGNGIYISQNDLEGIYFDGVLLNGVGRCYLNTKTYGEKDLDWYKNEAIAIIRNSMHIRISDS